ncbi:MAG: transcriptional repressor LexA [Gammaproteobacteria bacterium]|jgi:repressor LexA|nr:transcriptional repressor LexA [Gammaproteobacteria bacterium]MCP4880751.1 transcriptional repressor LexA [Gammaproteobacteria bacterium]MDP6166097.1 transcriptional repressor LexA [Gammaproteobacteria bacterium]
MLKLTPRQDQVLSCIREHITDTGYPPTRAEIAQELGFRSPNAAEDHLKALARKGAIEIIPGASRGIRVPDMDAEDKGLPIIGMVAAGSPMLAAEHISDYCALPDGLFYPKADYLLQVSGMSMKDIGIFDGDLLAVHKTDQARNGQIVVARVDDEVTVKRFQRVGNKVLLIAENEDYSPIEVDLNRQRLSIEGLSVGVIRRGS